MAATTARQWRIGSRRNDFQWTGPLVAYWELDHDPISDDYTPDEISAEDLFDRWVDKVKRSYPSGLVPIYWFVDSPGHGKFERMPFQQPTSSGRQLEDFLTFYSWPVNAKTGEPLNWLTLAVADKRWTSRRGDKGGFIQEVTGWKPAVLQPFVYLPSLMSTRGPLPVTT